MKQTGETKDAFECEKEKEREEKVKDCDVTLVSGELSFLAC